VQSPIVGHSRLADVRDDAADNDASTEILELTNAATRLFNTTLYVCPVGWSTKVYELNGAAAAVWQSLRACHSVSEVAADQNVAVDDSFLMDAVGMLLEAGLVHPVPRA
jgi:hypothetical protein